MHIDILSAGVDVHTVPADMRVTPNKGKKIILSKKSFPDLLDAVDVKTSTIFLNRRLTVGAEFPRSRIFLQPDL